MPTRAAFWSGKKPLYIRCRISPGKRMPQEQAHYHYEFMFNFSRIPIRQSVSGKTYETDTPYILFRAPLIFHSSNTLTDQEYKRYTVAIHPSFLTEYGGICQLGGFRSLAECLIPMTEEEMAELEPLLRMLETASNRKPALKHEQVALTAALLCRCCLLLEQKKQNRCTAIDSPAYIQDLLFYINENLDGDLRTETLAKRSFVSCGKLNANFQAVTGCSPSKYITLVRMVNARHWLREGVPISIIAERCGFSQDSSFIYAFRRIYGMTPGEYRSSQRG